MRKGIVFAAVLVLLVSGVAFATNGDNLIGIGPISRSMGGVGIASPQDAISAIFENPAAMCFAPYCPTTQMDFAGTLFMPHVKARVTNPLGTFSATADEKVYAIPAIGLSIPITDKWPYWRFGLAAFGVSGLGADYRGTALDQPNFAGSGAPLVAGEFTELQIMKFAPGIAGQFSDKFSAGLAAHIDYSSLDLRRGLSSGFGFGAQVGFIYKITDSVAFGLTYVSPQNVDHDNVSDFDGDGTLDKLKLESPQTVGVGLSYTTLGNKLLVEADVKWVNWSDANGFGDFDWKDQWVFGVGAQYFLTPKLSLRAGYNFGENPVKEHNGFNGGFNGAVPATTRLQGKNIPTYFYETFRVIGFPAIAEHHLTVGVGYQITPKFGVHAGYVRAFENTIRETGTGFFGPTTLESKLSEDAVDFALTWRF